MATKPASQRIVQILNLRNIVKSLPLLRKALEGSRSQLLKIIHEVYLPFRISKTWH